MTKTSAIALTITSSLVDTDSSETLSIAINGVPAGATLSAGTDNLDGSWTLTPAQLAGLTITPPAHSDSEFQLTVTATATESNPTSGDTTVTTLSAQTSATIDVQVDAVADAPTLNVTSSAAGDEDDAIAPDDHQQPAGYRQLRNTVHHDQRRTDRSRAERRHRQSATARGR